MNKILLITRPKHDITVHYLFHWAKQVIELAKSKSISVRESHEKSKNIFKENALRLATSESQDSYLIQFLVWDMRHQVCLGEEGAHF